MSAAEKVGNLHDMSNHVFFSLSLSLCVCVCVCVCVFSVFTSQCELFGERGSALHRPTNIANQQITTCCTNLCETEKTSPNLYSSPFFITSSYTFLVLIFAFQCF